jgi:hypothetical protein
MHYHIQTSLYWLILLKISYYVGHNKTNMKNYFLLFLIFNIIFLVYEFLEIETHSRSLKTEVQLMGNHWLTRKVLVTPKFISSTL